MAQTERERKVQERVLATVRKYGGYVYKNAQNMYTEKGRPDLTACIPAKLSKLVEIFGEDATVGLFVGLEIKRDCDHGYGTTEAQEVVGRKIKKANKKDIAVIEEVYETKNTTEKKSVWPVATVLILTAIVGILAVPLIFASSLPIL